MTVTDINQREIFDQCDKTKLKHLMYFFNKVLIKVEIKVNENVNVD